MSNEQGQTVMVDGRIVWTSGDLFAGRPKVDHQTKQPRLNKAGQPMTDYGFGLAVPKDVLGQSAPGQLGEIWSVIHAQAQSVYPQGLPPGFAMKYKDGDVDIDSTGVPYAQREGYAGHLVFACTTSIAIKWFKFENGNNIQVNEGIKCGDYVKVQLTVKAHPPVGQGKAGLYLNPQAVQLIGYGTEIVNTPSGDQIFGVTQPPMPTGASATPIAAQPGVPLMPQQPAVQQPVQQPAQPPMPQQPAAPNHAVLPPQYQPQVPPNGQPPMPQQPAVQQPAQPMPQQPGVPPMPGYPQQ